MKRITIILALLMVLLSCKSKETQNKITKNQEISSNENKNELNIKGEIDKPISITKEEFKKYIMNYEKNRDKWVYEGNLPCIVDFYADWCPPCKISSPILDELAKEYKGKIIIYKVNVDKEVELASLFGIRSIPSFLFCPLNDNPSMFSGIGRNIEETKNIFINHIENLLLKN